MQRGSSLFELLVFLPLFFLFIVAVVDLGLAFQEHSKFVNASRALTNTATAILRAEPFIKTNHLLETELNKDMAQDWLDALIKQFAAEVETTKSIGDSSQPLFNVQAAVLILSIDPISGELLPLELDEMTLAHTSFPLQHAPFETNSFNNKDYLPPRKYIANNIELAANHIPSLYARPLLSASGSIDAKFSPNTALLYLEISAEASGLKRFGVYSIFGRFFTLQQQQLVAFRN